MLDPLTALALAGNIVQFVDYGLKLLRNANEIAKSTSGATALNVELETVYSRLQTFTLELRLAGKNGPGLLPSYNDDMVDALNKAHIRAIQPHIDAIEEIAADCQAVCNELLDVIRSLRVKATSSRRLFASMAMALVSSLKNEHIETLKQRLNRFQKLLALQFLPLLK